MIYKGVYAIIFPNGKRYIGKSVSKEGINGRWRKYKVLKCKDQPKLYNALKKYGPENCEYKVILETNDDRRASIIEKQLIALWNTRSDNYGYNITEGGDGGCGLKHSKIVRLSLGKCCKKRWENKEYKSSMCKKFKNAWSDENLKQSHRDVQIKRWNDETLREMQGIKQRLLWMNLEFRKNNIEKNTKYNYCIFKHDGTIIETDNLNLFGKLNKYKVSMLYDIKNGKISKYRDIFKITSILKVDKC